MPEQVKRLEANEYITSDWVATLVDAVNASRLVPDWPFTVQVTTDGTALLLVEPLLAGHIAEVDGDLAEWQLDGDATRQDRNTSASADSDWLQDGDTNSSLDHVADFFGVPLLDGTRCLLVWLDGVAQYVPIVPFAWHYFQADEAITNGSSGDCILQSLTSGSTADSTVTVSVRNKTGGDFATDDEFVGLFHPVDGWVAPALGGSGGDTIEFGVMDADLTGPTASATVSLYDYDGVDTTTNVSAKCWFLGASETITSGTKVAMAVRSGKYRIIAADC